MKKILNWLFGSFFRTIGRVFGFLAVVILLLLIGSKIGLKIPDFLMPMQVSALSSENWRDNSNILSGTQWYIEDCTSSSCSAVNIHNNDINTNSGNNFQFISSQSSMTIATNGISFTFATPERMSKDYLYNVSVYVCSNKALADVDNYRIYSGSLTDTRSKTYRATYESAFGRLGLSDYPGSVDSLKFENCYQYTSLFVPKIDSGFLNFNIRSSTNSISGVYPSFIGYSFESVGIYSSSIETILKNSNLSTTEDIENMSNAIQETQRETTDAVDNVNDSINNDDTSGAQDSAGGFFDDFQSEDFGLSSIVTAPLRGINAMLNDTCVAPSATYKGQKFSLPCGSMLWNRPGGQDFRNFMNMMYGGFLAYLVIRKFFLDVENLKNPDSDKVEVDKL